MTLLSRRVRDESLSVQQQHKNREKASRRVRAHNQDRNHVGVSMHIYQSKGKEQRSLTRSKTGKSESYNGATRVYTS